MRLIQWGVSALAATLVATVLVAPANAATGLTVTVNVTHDATPVTGGCVDIYEVGEHMALDAECADAGGAVTFTGVSSGTYEFHVRDFNGGLATLWYGGSVGRSGAADVVVDEDNLNLAVDLPDGASITGELGGDFQGAKVSVFTPDLELVSTSDVNGDGSWEVGQLAAGEYYVWYYGFNAKAGAWYKTGSAPDHGSRTLVTVDPGWPGSSDSPLLPPLTFTAISTRAHFGRPDGCLVPTSPDAPGTVKTWKCGQPGTPFHWVGLIVGQYYKFRVVRAAGERRRVARRPSHGRVVWEVAIRAQRPRHPHAARGPRAVPAARVLHRRHGVRSRGSGKSRGCRTPGLPRATTTAVSGPLARSSGRTWRGSSTDRQANRP